MRSSLVAILLLAAAVRADEPKAAPKTIPIDPKEVKVGPPPELARLRKAVDEAARKGENVDEIRKELEALEKAFVGRAWVAAPAAGEPGGEPVFLATLFTRGAQPLQFSAAYGPFTLKGPKTDSLKALPKDLHHVIYDPVGKKHYGVNHHAVYEVDVENGTKTEMQIPANLPKLSWAYGIAYDSKRGRILVSSFGGVGHLYAFTPKTSKWELICELDNVDLAALTYDAKSDLIYGFPMLYDRGPLTISARNANGAIVSKIELSDPAFPQGRRTPADTPIQIVVHDGKLVLITDAKIVAMDLKTEKATVTWERK
jgi:hypothetical protein